MEGTINPMEGTMRSRFDRFSGVLPLWHERRGRSSVPQIIGRVDVMGIET
jgi:hypothetical protein